MARKITRMPAREGCQYPWEEWLDGDVWELTAGEDFLTSVHAFRGNAYMAAYRRSMKASIQVRDGKVFLQARPR